MYIIFDFISARNILHAFFFLLFAGNALVMSDSSDRHKTPRVFASGAQKRKNAAEREKKEGEMLAKIPKLTSFFTVAVKPVIDENAVLTNSEPESPDEENDNRTNVQIAEPEPIILEKHTSIDINPTLTKVDDLGNDIGFLPDIPTKEMIAFGAIKVPVLYRIVTKNFLKKKLILTSENVQNICFSVKIKIMRP
jgi:hypothetical protein